MKSTFKRRFSEDGLAASKIIGVIFVLTLLVTVGALLSAYAMRSWRATSVVVELKKRANSVLNTASLAMKEFPENDCQGYVLEGIQEDGDDIVYLFRLKNVDAKMCQLLVERYPTEWFHLFINNKMDVSRSFLCGENNTMDFAFMKQREKPLPDCSMVTCYNQGTCLRGICTCPRGVSGKLCTRTDDCTGRENGTRCVIPGRNFDGVCAEGMCQNEGECPALTWDEAQLFCQGHDGLPEVTSLYDVSGQLVESNEGGYWMSYLKNPYTQNEYRRTSCFADSVVVWTKESTQDNADLVWSVEMISGNVLPADKQQKRQVLCNKALTAKRD